MNKKFTKYFSIVLSTLIATINIPVVYASSFIVNENFNNMKLHTSPTGYQVSDADSIYTVDINGADDYCVYLDDKEGQLKLNKPFAPQTEVVNLSVDFMQKQLGSGTHINMTDRTGLRAIRLETRQNGTTLEYVSSDGSYDKPSAAFINCQMDSHIKVEPWTSMSGTPASHGRFFEYQSTGAGAVINPSRPQLTDEEVSYYTISNVLKGWIPSFSVKETLPEEKPPVVTPPTEETPSTPEQTYFTDITPNDSYYDAVVFLAEKGYVK